MTEVDCGKPYCGLRNAKEVDAKIAQLSDALRSVLDAIGALSNPTELHGLMGITEAEEVFDALKGVSSTRTEADEIEVLTCRADSWQAEAERLEKQSKLLAEEAARLRVVIENIKTWGDATREEVNKLLAGK